MTTTPQTVGRPEAGGESLAMPAMALEAASGAQTRKQNAGEPSLFSMNEKPTTSRDDTWKRIQGRLTGQRQKVYEAYLQHGPCTTMELAGRSGISPFGARPRTTELHALGLIEVVGHKDGSHSREGVYRAIPLSEAQYRFEAQSTHIYVQPSFL